MQEVEHKQEQEVEDTYYEYSKWDIDWDTDFTKAADDYEGDFR